jgi:hypothetical protein
MESLNLQFPDELVIVFTLSVLGSDYLRFKGGHAFSCHPICYCTGPVTSCRIVRWTASIPTFAPSVVVLCPDRLTENAMVCYIEVRRDWMPLRTPLIFAVSVLGSDYLRFKGDRTFSCHPIHYCPAPGACCRIVRQVVSMPAFGHNSLSGLSGRKCNVLLY